MDKLRNKWDHEKSLNGEDAILLPTLVNAARGRPGTFVELGAFTGEHSNTALLEHCFGWRGLLLEPNPANFAKLQKRARPRSRKVHTAICPSTGAGKATVRFTLNGGPVAGQVDMLSASHQRDWAKVNRPSQAVDVPCQPLERLMEANGLGDGATFLSLDVEGSEELVLSTVRPSAFQIIMVELDGSDPAKDERVERRILADGFSLEPTLTRQISNSSRVYTRASVMPRPLPDKWYRQGRFASRFTLADRVNASFLSRLLTHAAEGSVLDAELSTPPPRKVTGQKLQKTKGATTRAGRKVR